MCSTTTTGRPTVLLLHELPDKTRHVDWMIAQDPRGRDPLITFRLDERVDQLAQGKRTTARRIADHRSLYLEYQGRIEPDRGSVTRLARGVVVSGRLEHESGLLEVHWVTAAGGGRRQTLRLDRRGPCDWLIWPISVPDRGERIEPDDRP